MNKKLLTIALLAIFVVVMLTKVFFGIVNVVNSPKSELYFKASIHGSHKEIANTQFAFTTYDKNMNEVRTEKIKIFLSNNFVINYGENERFIKVYTTDYKVTLKKPGLTSIPQLEPDGVIDLATIQENFVCFCFNTFTVKKK